MTMRPSLLPLLLIISLALVGGVSADVENFQNGPGGYYKTVYRTTYFDELTALPVTATPNIDTFYANPSNNYIIYGTGGYSNYFSIVPPTSIQKTSPGGTSTRSLGTVHAWNPDGSKIATAMPSIVYKNYDYLERSRVFVVEFRREDGKIYYYVNGIRINTGVTCANTPYYYTYFADTVDDAVMFQPVAGVVGIMPHDWNIVKDIANPLLSGMYNSLGQNVYNSEMHASWTSYVDTAGAYICIDGDQQVQLVGTETFQIRDYANNYQNTTFRSGIVTFNLTQFEAENEYGKHTVELHVGGDVISEEFWYLGSASQETNITFDRDIYAPQDSIQIESSISNAHYQPGYSFRGDLVYYDPSTGTRTVKETWPITTQTHAHSTSVTTDLFPVTGEYVVELYAVDANGDAMLNYDTAQMYADKIVYSGTVWDGQQGTVIEGATVSVTQGGTTTTDTTGSDGRFEIVGLSKDVLTQLSGAKTGFVTTWANMTPDEYKRYEFDLILPPTGMAGDGESVFGTVRCYPDGATVSNATVSILKDGSPVNSTTSAEKGFYFFPGLDATTAYTIAVEKDNYADYSNAVVTGSGGSLTQLDPWLLPADYTLTVLLKDSVTNQTITRQMAVSLGGQSVQTTNGTATFTGLGAGSVAVAVVGDGYDPLESIVVMTGDQTATLFIIPSPVVVTTAPGMTPTPTPAIVDMSGHVYDGMTGLPIEGATVTVAMDQLSVTRTDTSDANGAYGIENLKNGVLTTVNATADGYYHTPFSFTPQGSAGYIVNIVMYRTDESENPTIDPQPGKAGAGGMVLGGDMHLPLDSPTVVASNGTWNGTATVTDTGVWYFDNLEPNTAYDFTASDEGYVTNTVEATMGGPDSFTVVEIVLAGVYDVTIEIHDAESYAIIYKPVSLTLSNGVKGNTSTGSYVFTNLQYAQYVVTAACEGYTAGGLSFVAYGDHTEYLYLSKLPVSGGSSIQYDIPPKPVEILARNIFGVPLAGVAVSVQGGATTLPDRGLLAAFFGWGDDYSSADLANATMTGTTGSDGGITFMMTDALKYTVTFSDPARGIDETVELMPHDTQYMFILGSMGAAPVAGMPNMTLWADGAEGASPTLRGYYSDPAGTTSALYFVVERINGTVRTEVNNQSLGAVQTASPSFAVNHTTGAMYSWGFRATTPDRGALQQWNGITLHSRLVELPIEESMYFWVSMCLVFLFAGLFSGNNIKYGFVAFPMFCGVLWYIGWLDIAGITLGIVMVLGILMYLAKVQVA